MWRGDIIAGLFSLIANGHQSIGLPLHPQEKCSSGCASMDEILPVAGLSRSVNEEATAMNEQEFRSLYDATALPIRNYLLGVTGHREVAEDVLQETYCRFLVRQPPPMEENETRRYLFRIATNLLRDRWRRGEDEPRQEVSECGFSVNAEAQLDVRAAMRALKPRERELLWLAYVEGMNHAEVAAATGLRVISVRMLLFRARRKAAELLAPKKGRV
jgi:RNA polymerase sigma-70 factor, ECF subfamily